MNALVMWVIYDHPSDFPEHFVARRWVGESPTTDHVLADSLEDVRTKVATRFAFVPSMLPRFENDDPKIVEVWL